MRTDLILAVLILAMSNIAMASCNQDNLVDLDEGTIYQVSGNKAYKLVDGLVSNEWVPLTADGYEDNYEHSDKAKVIAAANASLKKIRND